MQKQLEIKEGPSDTMELQRKELQNVSIFSSNPCLQLYIMHRWARIQKSKGTNQIFQQMLTTEETRLNLTTYEVMYLYFLTFV